MLKQFMFTTYALAAAGQWRALKVYLQLIRDLSLQPEAVITPGLPLNKKENN